MSATSTSPSPSTSAPTQPIGSKEAEGLYQSATKNFNRVAENLTTAYKNRDDYSFQTRSQFALGGILLVSAIAFTVLNQLAIFATPLVGAAVMAGVGLGFCYLGYTSLNQKVDDVSVGMKDKFTKLLGPIVELREQCATLLGELSRVNRTNLEQEEEDQEVDHKTKNLKALYNQILDFQKDCESKEISKIDFETSVEEKKYIQMKEESLEILKQLDENLKAAFTEKFNEIVKSPNQSMLPILVGTALVVASAALLTLGYFEMIAWNPQLATMIGGTGLSVFAYVFLNKRYGNTKATTCNASFFDDTLKDINDDVERLIVSVQNSIEASKKVRPEGHKESAAFAAIAAAAAKKRTEKKAAAAAGKEQ